MKRLVIMLIIGLLAIPFVSAQNEMDALRYSRLIPGGTARFASTGSAFGALGGDFSSLSLNPAGIAIYRGSEFTISPSLKYSQVDTRYFSTLMDDMKYDLNLGNLGVVLAFPIGNKEEGGWQFINMGFGINRHNNFNDRWIAQGFNTNNSLMTSMMEQANREGSVENLSDFSTGLAWDTWLLGEDDEGFFVDMPDGGVLQQQETNSSGSLREFVLSMGANYNDRVYIGATFGFPTVSYEEESRYTEEDSQDRDPVFNSLAYTTNLKTEGNGYNFKVGAIVRVTDMIRLGGAFHSPTFLDLSDRYSATMSSDLILNSYNQTSSSSSEGGRFDYELTTPLKAMGSLGLVFGTRGLVSLDYEFTDYSNARLRSPDYSFTEENNTIRDSFTAQHGIRVGGELRLHPLILRAGYGQYTSPYVSGVNDGERTLISGGIGLREQNYFIDFSYTHSFYEEDYYLYQLDGLAPVEREFSASIFRITFGRRF
ncbi:MAG: OmpP1/FadL family transporter [Bacteroidales bacterium]